MNSTISTATATTTATRRAALAYLNHFIRRQSGENAALVADLALRGKRLPGYCMFCGGHRCGHNEWCALPLAMPSEFILESAKMSSDQAKIARRIAQSFGHLWASFECPVEWADHFNNGCEDGYNPSNHPLPTPEDETASGRYKWSVNRLGVVDFKINRPAGIACRVTGTLTDFKIEITKLSLDRHLVCLFQQLQSVFGLTTDEAIDRIETARGFSLMGIRSGELHKVVLA